MDTTKIRKILDDACARYFKGKGLWIRLKPHELKVLTVFLSSNSKEWRLITSAVFILSKTRSKKHKPLLNELLKRQLKSKSKKAGESIFQTLCALEDLGEPKIMGRQGSDILSISRNRQFANIYLKKMSTQKV